jgi:hypothetical protein
LYICFILTYVKQYLNCIYTTIINKLMWLGICDALNQTYLIG